MLNTRVRMNGQMHVSAPLIGVSHAVLHGVILFELRQESASFQGGVHGLSDPAALLRFIGLSVGVGVSVLVAGGDENFLCHYHTLTQNSLMNSSLIRS